MSNTEGNKLELKLQSGATTQISEDTSPKDSAEKGEIVVQDIGGLTLKKRSTGDSGPSPTRSYAGAPPSGASSAPTSAPSHIQRRMERFSRVMPTRDPGVRMNENIRAAEIRVIDDEGQIGVMSPREAMEIARERGVDLIEIVGNAKPPVCKLIDFGKWKYEQQKRDKMAKKTSHQQLLKEVRFHPATDTHDFEFKLRHAQGFLEEGHKVKATVQFRGREVAYRQFGEELLNQFKERLADLSKVDQDISMMGKQMTMMLSPTGKRKKEEKNKAELAAREKSAKKLEKNKAILDALPPGDDDDDDSDPDLLSLEDDILTMSPEAPMNTSPSYSEDQFEDAPDDNLLDEVDDDIQPMDEEEEE